MENLDLYRLSLITKQSPLYDEVTSHTAQNRWGIFEDNLPLTQQNLDNAKVEEQEKEQKPFQMFEETPSIAELKCKRIARSILFRATIQKLYDATCSVCRVGLQSPRGLFEVNAAHIVPKSKQGSDDVRNGLSLCRTHHWAFDHGLFSVDENRKVFVPSIVLSIRTNKALADFHGAAIKEANDKILIADSAALLWHADNVLIR